jgi:hypothetical protein
LPSEALAEEVSFLCGARRINLPEMTLINT